MAQRQQRAERPLGQVKGRQGGRWYNEKPTAEEVAEWFKLNVKLHDGLEHDRYVGGLTLIPQKEYAEEVKGDKLVKIKNLVYTPYSKVESRVMYFWDLMLAHPEWEGSIEPVDPIAKDKQRDGDLPKGFYRVTSRLNQKEYPFIACCMRVRVVERNTNRHNGVLLPSPATKMIPVIKENYGSLEVDPHVLMKAETGAVGRALGMAGMLVIPGAGVATAEDMLEAQAQEPVESGEVESASLFVPESAKEQPQVADGAEIMRKEVEKLVADLKKANPDAHRDFQTWAKERGFKWSACTEQQLRGIVKKLEKLLQDVDKPLKEDDPA